MVAKSSSQNIFAPRLSLLKSRIGKLLELEKRRTLKLTRKKTSSAYPFYEKNQLKLMYLKGSYLPFFHVISSFIL